MGVEIFLKEDILAEKPLPICQVMNDTRDLTSFHITAFLSFCLVFFCSCSTIPKIIEDPAVKNKSLGERLVNYHKKHLSYFKQTAFDSSGNTLTHLDLKELFEKEGDTQALRSLGFNPKNPPLFSSVVVGGALLFSAFKVDGQGWEQERVQNVKASYIILSTAIIAKAVSILFNKNLTSELFAINVYNTNLLKRYGIPISYPSIF